MEKEFDNMQNDPFLDAFRNKLTNYSMPVDSGVWKEVGKTIGPKAKRLPLWLVWSLSSAAAVALIITFGTFFINSQLETTEITANKVEKNVISADEKPTETTETVDSVVNQIIPAKADIQPAAMAAAYEKVRVNRKYNPSNDKTVQTSVKTESAIPLKEKDLSVEMQPIATIDPVSDKKVEYNEPVIATTNPATSTVKETTTEQNVKQTAILQIAQASKDWTDDMLKKQDDLVQVSLGVGSGVGGTSALSFGRNMDYMSEKLATAETAMANIMAPEDFPDKNYLPPVSVGMLFRLKTAKNISFESGLVYSYLLTTMSRENSWSDARAELNLHYLGIPLNAVVSLYEEGKWSIYCSGGLMFEKGLWSFYKQEVYQGPATITTTASKSIDGLQWSLNASLGLSYNVTPDVSLFFDPKLSWYADNNQPFSVRTHMPLLIGIQAGIRTHF